MGKALTGAAELAGAAVIDAAAILSTGGIAAAFQPIFFGLVAGGIASEAGAIAQALGSKSGLGITTRTPAAQRQIIRGTRRVGGTIVYQSTTGGTHRQYNMVIVLATHVVDAIENLYLDGRQVYWSATPITTTANFNRTRNGVNFGGDADGSNHTGPNGVQYNFGGKIFCEAFFGDQDSTDDQSGGVLNPTGGFSTALHANDATWARDGSGNTPYLAGCTWVYLKIEADAGTFPQFPEIRFTVRGKNDIWDPRTATRGYTTNWALHVADAITDPVWGLNDNSVNQAQLIAAANVCDELVSCAAGLEARYALNWAYDTGTSPGEAIQHMMPAAMGRLSRVSGEWFIWPAYWQGPSISFDQNSLLGDVNWSPKRAVADLVNRVRGTYTAANYPYNVAGNLYDSNGYWNGGTANNFPFAFQPTNFPEYAADPTHGYTSDVYLVADTPNLGAWNAGISYAAGAVVIYGGAPWQALQAVPAGTVPAAGSAYWAPAGNYYPMDLSLDTVLSVSQAQRLAKIALMRNRQQGSATLLMALSALQMMPLDVMQFTFPALGFASKYLEIAGAPGAELKLRCAPPPRAAAGESSEQDETPAFWLEVPVNETNISVYQWDPAEELTPYDMQAIAGGANVWTVAAPTALTLADNATTALLLSNGATLPRILVAWTPPDDTYVTNGGSIQIQWQDADLIFQSGAWVDAPAVSGQATSCLVEVAASITHVNVQIRGVRPNGAASAWTSNLQPVTAPAASMTAIVDALTASPGTSNTQLATTAFVQAAIGSGGVASIQITVSTLTIAANSSSSAFTATMTGLTTSSSLAITPASDISAVTGWSPGTAGSVYFTAWPTANTLNYRICNPTGASITLGASTTWNVSAR